MHVLRALLDQEWRVGSIKFWEPRQTGAPGDLQAELRSPGCGQKRQFGGWRLKLAFQPGGAWPARAWPVT